MKNIIIYVVTACLCVSLGCARREDDKVLVRVGNRVISLREAKEKMARLPAYYQTIVSRDKKKFLDDLIAEELFYEEAVRQDLLKDKETQDVIREAKKKIVIAKLIKKEVEDKVRVDDDAVKKYYEEHKGEFMSPEMWRASHVLVASGEEAQEIAKGINSGALKFEEVAGSRSLDATAKRGGDIGYFAKGQLVPEFEEACFSLNVGDPCQIVRTQFGYHVIKLTDRRPGKAEELEKVRAAIIDRLRRNAKKDLFGEFISNLREKYKVEVEEDALAIFEGGEKGAKEKAPAGAAVTGSGERPAPGGQ